MPSGSAWSVAGAGSDKEQDVKIQCAAWSSRSGYVVFREIEDMSSSLGWPGEVF